ncbi:MAG: AIR synthase family protein [Christensenellales bacterium]|jgi:hydrogenase expression/formation protein HypE
MRIGKLTNEQLKRIILSKINPKHDVLAGAGVGEDCAALDFGGEACVLSTDPITGASENVGALAVHISCNDVASSGTRPVAMLVTLLVPPDNTLSDVENVVSEIIAEADSLGVDIIGGHTEVTDAVSRIVVSTTAIGRTKSSRLIKSSGAKPGDDIIMTGYAAIEGTYIIATEYKSKLDSVLTETEFKKALDLGSKISVVKEGVIAGEFGVTAMHDITEGGVYGAVCELCEASHVGCEINKDKIPLLDVTNKICTFLGINPYRLIGSGSMLITTADSGSLIRIFRQNGINAAIIGRITKKDIRVDDGGRQTELSLTSEDELFLLRYEDK